MRAKREDVNHAEIRDGLRKAGYYVWDMHDMGDGFPDLLCCTKVYSIAVLLEVKQPGEKLTPAQVEFHKKYPGPKAIVYSLGEALAVMEHFEALWVEL